MKHIRDLEKPLKVRCKSWQEYVRYQVSRKWTWKTWHMS